VKRWLVPLCSCALVLFFGACPSAGQKRVYVTGRVNSARPVIDGRLEDPVWNAVPWGDSFVQREPREGGPPSQETAFKILFDEKNLYVAVRCFDREPERIVRRVARRDTQDGDRVGIQLDTFFDHRTAFVFTINAAGVKCDEICSGDGGNWDDSWDPVWFAAVAQDDSGWTAEMRIPFSQLRYGNEEDHVWGLQFHRYLYRLQEWSNWQFIPQEAPGWVSNFGELRGLVGIRSPRRVELLPYAVGKLERFEREAGNPFATGSLTDLAGGLDAKVGVTSDLTMDLTVNPDFGQVEADPSVVNLTAFETRYEEKRPFFIEGRNILDYRITLGDSPFSFDTPFYSRRIGRFPQHCPDTGDDEYLKMPEGTSILGAAKLTGKTKSGISVGIMDAVTARETAEIDSAGRRRREEVEPLTNYFVARLQKDYRQGSTVVGGMLTATNRNLDTPELNFLHHDAYSGAFDLTHQWADRTYFLDLKTAFSHVLGSPEALLETQTSPVHYFQRPDEEHVQVDSSKTALSGHGGSLTMGRSGSGHFGYGVSANWRSPGLELNDLGYLHQGDIILGFLWANYRVWEPFSIFQRLHANLNLWGAWNFGRENVFNGGNVNGNVQFLNYWGLGAGVNREREGLSTHLLRGGPALRVPGSWNTWCFLRTDSRKRIEFRLSGSVSRGDDGFSGSRRIGPALSWRPTDALRLSLDPSYSVSKNKQQYVDTIEREDGNRYILASLTQKTFALTMRASYCLTPDLSIQFYAQPFVSVGKYSGFKKVSAHPRADRYEDRFEDFSGDQIEYSSEDEVYWVDEDLDGTNDYYFDKPDFNFREFHSNLVIRWEYKPGSTLFLVWSQGRTGYETDGEFAFSHDLSELFHVQPANVFMVKVNHWFSL